MVYVKRDTSCWKEGPGDSNSAGWDWTGTLPCKVSLKSEGASVGQCVLGHYPTGASEQDHTLVGGVGFPVQRRHFPCQWPRLLLEQETRFGEIGLRLEELGIASQPWALALRAGRACRTWRDLASPRVGLWAVRRASLHPAVLCSPLWCPDQEQDLFPGWKRNGKGKSIPPHRARLVFDALT